VQASGKILTLVGKTDQQMPKIRLTEKLVRWAGIPVIALISCFFLDDHNQQFGGFWYGYLISLVFTTVYWNGAVLIFFSFRKIYPEISKTGLRLTLTYLLLMVFMLMASLGMKAIFGQATGTEIVSWSSVIETMPFSIIISLFIGTLYEATFFFYNWKETFKQNELLKTQQIKTQFEVLQNQMSPHFLFNSLNTLTTLIAENPQVAIDFTQNLSEVYRYILQHKERELVTLREEIEFAKAYFFLLKMRYPDNLDASFSVDESYLSQHIAPLTLQMLLENAIKHNVVSKIHPLKIEIYVESNNSVIVKNNLQPKTSLERSTKTGLKNIQKRYEYLGRRKIDVITTAKNFIVAIPLIQLIEDKHLPVAAHVA
jgi:two-component system, LytTR family, sensor kinase